eukprot:COSAG01_NODE_7018_length_3391_cov_2.202309_3_plen_49_part_00
MINPSEISPPHPRMHSLQQRQVRWVEVIRQHHLVTPAHTPPPTHKMQR